MGTNVYLISKNKDAVLKYFGNSYKIVDEPDFGYKIHVMKRSAGWIPLWQAHENCRSVRAYKNAYASGLFEIYDEYGTKYNWSDFWEDFAMFNGGKLGAIKPKKIEPYHGNINIPVDNAMPEYTPVSHIPGSIQSYKYRYKEDTDTIYTDPEGCEFEEREFS